MSHRLIAALAAACLPCVSMASNLTFDSVSAQCSDQLSVLATPGLSWRCTGDLALSSVGGGVASLSNGVSINLYASGNLTLNNVALNAPIVSLEALGLTLGLHSPINAPDVVLISPRSQDASSIHLTFDPNVLAQLLPPFVITPPGQPVLPGDVVLMGNGSPVSAPAGVGAVPEPDALGMFGIGLLAVGTFMRRRQA